MAIKRDYYEILGVPRDASDEEIKRFRETAAKPVWDKWVADNKAKFDAQGLLDTLLKELEKANAKHAPTR